MKKLVTLTNRGLEKFPIILEALGLPYHLARCLIGSEGNVPFSLGLVPGADVPEQFIDAWDAKLSPELLKSALLHSDAV